MSTTSSFLDDSRMRELLGYRLAIAGAVAHRVFDDCVGKPLTLRRVDYTILVLVDANPDTTHRQLARSLGLSLPYLTVTLDKLVARGLLTREPNDTDRRSSLLKLTKDGKKLVRRATSVAATMEQKLLGRLDRGEAALLFALLDKITTSSLPHAPSESSEEALGLTS